MTTGCAKITAAGQRNGGRPPIEDARIAVRNFLQTALPEQQRVNVTKLAPLDPAEGAWEAEAVVWLPNATVEALGLPIQRPVLEQEVYVVRLDNALSVLGYELKAEE